MSVVCDELFTYSFIYLIILCDFIIIIIVLFMIILAVSVLHTTDL